MPLSAADVQKRILERTGDFDPTTGDPVQGGGGYLEQQIAGVWAQYADKAYVAPRLQELYTERDLLERYIAAIRHRYNMSADGVTENRDQRTERLIGQRDHLSENIEQVEATASANRAPAVGPLLTTAPVSSPFAGSSDANSPRYGGSPYWRRPWGYP
jgi:hypothetical protein